MLNRDPPEEACHVLPHGGIGHPLTAPTVKPRMKYFWKKG